VARIRGDLLDRSFEFAKSMLTIVDSLPNNAKGWEIGRQMIRCGTSVGANLREADNAHTDADFVYKCSIARKEASETHYWLQSCDATALLTGKPLHDLIKEVDEIVRIPASIVRKTQQYVERS
jgi:four helix bundle protein